MSPLTKIIFRTPISTRYTPNLRSDWQTFIRIQVMDELNIYMDRAFAAHTLRGFDAIHLASAMILHEKFQESLLFICFDQRLAQAAGYEGMNTYGG